MQAIKELCWCCYLVAWLCFWGCTQRPISSISLSPQLTNPVETSKPMIPQSKLPTTVIDAVRQKTSNLIGIETSILEIKVYEAKTWPDSCLGLARPDEFCTQALVEGWRVVVTNGSKTWVYRTNGDGREIRLESQP
ncbi:MAG: hypothetical protein ACTMUB_00470 [cyanobacterium endosymbiont of Rhopalodia musculus]|uniref:hypothetical protein n=1 Tax=cyanobacterium endosymbiont of Epithemia clementina EcSB TaxID=3034674 RepID=UPI00247FA49B|nr:hypothetical protein [cyanobacterium endosymbiont of Epithemia clementina EcSB]WGT66754.1 hypothetical protein P3F56_05695 [cyanobacterium endosymbiont of Epithemia clementina EcSB]